MASQGPESLRIAPSRRTKGRCKKRSGGHLSRSKARGRFLRRAGLGVREVVIPLPDGQQRFLFLFSCVVYLLDALQGRKAKLSGNLTLNLSQFHAMS